STQPNLRAPGWRCGGEPPPGGISSVSIITSRPGTSASVCFMSWLTLVAGACCCAATVPRWKATASAAKPRSAKVGRQNLCADADMWCSFLVGWVERSETHHKPFTGTADDAFAALNPSYASTPNSAL